MIVKKVRKNIFYQKNPDKYLKDKFNMIVKKITKLSSKGWNINKYVLKYM